MKRTWFSSWFAGWLLLTGMQSGLGGETNALPHFQEVFRLLRANLPGVSEEELNRAAVKGLLEHFQSRVMLVSGALETNGPASDALVSRADVYDGTFGCLRVARVAAGLADQIRVAHEKLDAANGLKGLVLDLRFATGDDYAAAAGAADLFLKKERALLSWRENELRSRAKTNALTLPLAVLVNRQTTGAAEALAAVLRETDVALVIGSATAGRAHLFKEFELSNGRRIRIAAESVEVGEGELLHNGVTPDIEVVVSAEDERAYFADAFTVRPKSVASSRGAAPSPSQAASTNRPPRRRINEAELVRMQREGIDVNDAPEDAPEREREKGEPVVRDPPLVRALDLLKALAVMQPSR